MLSRRSSALLQCLKLAGGSLPSAKGKGGSPLLQTCRWLSIAPMLLLGTALAIVIVPATTAQYSRSDQAFSRRLEDPRYMFHVCEAIPANPRRVHCKLEACCSIEASTSRRASRSSISQRNILQVSALFLFHSQRAQRFHTGVMHNNWGGDDRARQQAPWANGVPQVAK
jgi:hypothetical protein